MYPDANFEKNIVSDIQENYSNGWIKLYRSIKKHWVWQNNLYLKLWIDFIMRSNHSPNKILIEGELVEIVRGSFITSLKKLARENLVSISKIRLFLKLLEQDSMILLKTTHKYTQITINNYDVYQDERHAERNQKEIKKKTESTQKETNKNDKNVKNDKNEDINLYNHPLQLWIKNNLPEVSRLENQLTETECEKLLAEYPDQMIKTVLSAMENYKPLLKKYKSVNLTLRNWLKRENSNGRKETQETGITIKKVD